MLLNVLNLVKEFKGLLGKPYLMSGLLPAALVLLLWKAYLLWPFDAADTVASLVNKSATEFSADVVSFGIWILAAGLLLFATRGVLLSYLQELGFPFYGPLRRALVNWQKIKILRLENIKDVKSFQATAVWWAGEGLPLAYDQIVPKALRWPEVRAQKYSSKARAILEKLGAEEQRPRPCQERALIKGLCALRAYCRQDPKTQQTQLDQEWIREHDLWVAALGQPYPLLICQRLFNEIERQIEPTMEQRGNYPCDAARLKPTALGNRAASLDEYALLRYKMETGTLWSHLSPLLEEKQTSPVGDSQLAVQMMVNLACALWALAGFSLLSALAGWLWFRHDWAWLALLHVPDLQFSLIFWLFLVLCLVLGMLAYNASLFAHDVMSQRMIALIDLYRSKVIEAMTSETKLTLAQEVKVFAALNAFFGRGQLSAELGQAAAPPDQPPPENPAPSAAAGGGTVGTDPPLTPEPKSPAPPEPAPQA